jgi:signal transduction histidine kinase
MTTSATADPRLPELLSVSVHEFRSPVTVVAGYIRMLLKDRAGSLTDQQRRLLEDAEKSCARLSTLLAEMSDLSNLEAGKAPFNRNGTDFRALLAEAIAALAPVPDRQIDVDLTTGEGPALVNADAVRLRGALTSVLHAIRREVVNSTRLFVRERIGEYGGRRASWVAIGDADQIASLEAAGPEALTTFDEWRGGCGLSLPVARRIVAAHGGALWSPAEKSNSGAVVVLPHA